MKAESVIDSRSKGGIHRYARLQTRVFPNRLRSSCPSFLAGVLNNFRCAAVRGAFLRTIISWRFALAN